MQTIEKPDLCEVIEREGIQLRQRGRNLVGSCPFHSEKTPSFCVDPEKQKWRCFGACNEGGDAIDFIQRLRGVSFADALKYLGISVNRQITNPQGIKRRGLVQKFNEWCCNYTKYLSEMLRLCNQIDALVKTHDGFELKGLEEMYLLRDVYQYHLSVLNSKNYETKFELYKEVRHGS